MRSQIYKPARRRMKLTVAAQLEFLVDRPGHRTERQKSENPNESVDKQLLAPAAEIGRLNCACGRATFLPLEDRTRRNRRSSAPSDNSPQDRVPATRFPLREFPLLFARGPRCTAAAREDISTRCVRPARQ